MILSMPGEAPVPVLKLPVVLLSNLHAKKLSKLFFFAQISYIYIVDKRIHIIKNTHDNEST